MKLVASILSFSNYGKNAAAVRKSILNIYEYSAAATNIYGGTDMKLDESNLIHPLAYIGDNVEMGKNNYIGAFCTIDNCIIGDDNHFEGYCSIGSPPEHKKANSNYGALIGNANTFREFVTINGGVEQKTMVGNDNWMLAKSHLGHDAEIYDTTIISTGVIIGGHCKVFSYANLGLGCIIHQYKHIPHGTMLGMGCIVTKKSQLQPFHIYIGNPAKELKPNLYHLQNKILSGEQINNYCKLWT